MRPPMSDDESDDYYDLDGFSMGDEFDEKRRTRTSYQSAWGIQQQRENEELNRVVAHIRNGDLDGLKRELIGRYGSEAKIEYDSYLKDGWTLMLHAVSNLQLDIVTHLINKGASVNCEADSLTPLMMVCKLEPYPTQIDDIVKIAKLLLGEGAVVNVRNSTGFTPFMYACSSGNKEIVDLLVNLTAIDAVDNHGKTALHYAVENKHFDIVELLVSSGADIQICDSAGQRPREVAVSLNLGDIVNLFPEEIVNFIPSSAQQYETFQDLVPSIFPDCKIATYSQDIPTMLRGMRVPECDEQFYKANISLAQFLTIDDAQLQSIGIAFEYQRKRILLGLLNFHAHPFSPRSLDLVYRKQQKNMYDYYGMYAGYLKHLVMMQSALVYLQKIGGLKNVHERTINVMLESVHGIQSDLIALQKCVRQMSSISTVNPLYIGPAVNQSQRYKNVLRPIFKYSVIIGMGILLSYKFIKLLP